MPVTPGKSNYQIQGGFIMADKILQAEMTARFLGVKFLGPWDNGDLEFLDPTTGADITVRRCKELRVKLMLSRLSFKKGECDFPIKKTPDQLQAEEDFRTERADMPERIAAGLATKAEINKYMQDDFNFINETYGPGN
jgi:hypothetical protein